MINPPKNGEVKPKIPQWRRNQIKDASLVVLDECQVGMLPVSIEDILAHYGWNKETMDYAAARGVVLEGTDDGYTLSRLTPDGWQYIIIYNRFCSAERIYWTLAHEVGHIVLGHANRSAIKREWGWESEANYFAREILTPIAVLDELGARTASQIAEACGVSYEAASIREADFARRDGYKARHGNTAHDMAFLKQFAAMFNTEFAAEFYIDIAA